MAATEAAGKPEAMQTQEAAGTPEPTGMLQARETPRSEPLASACQQYAGTAAHGGRRFMTPPRHPGVGLVHSVAWMCRCARMAFRKVATHRMRVAARPLDSLYCVEAQEPRNQAVLGQSLLPAGTEDVFEPKATCCAGRLG